MRPSLAIQAGIPMARVELLDEMQVRVCNAYSKLAMPEQPTLFVEFHGTHAGVAEQAQRFGEIAARVRRRAASNGPRRRRTARGCGKTRHDVFWGLRSYRAGAKVVVTDVCVPISRLADCVAETKADIERIGIIAPIVGHVGDGNFHASAFVNMEDAEEVARAKAFIDRVAERALAMEGTCTGEHGIGQGKKHFMEPEHGLRRRRGHARDQATLDPAGIMNPGKIV